VHILFTDSGVGGLSVCAYAEAFLRANGVAEPTRLTYVNAAAENEFGYNALASRREKLEHFDRFLHTVADKYAPDQICVACNTLSVLLQDTVFFSSDRLPVRGIVETGIKRLLDELTASPGSNVMIFGTATTIEAQTYTRKLIEQGIPAESIISQACPGLADTISEDYQGIQAAVEIEGHVHEALAKSQTPAGLYIAYLACTHYGYRKDLFTEAFEKVGLRVEVLNPNEFVAIDLFGANGRSPDDSAIEVEFVTRYRIPETALKTINFFLGNVSPKTASALLDYTYAPDLFPGFRPSGQAS